MDPLLARKLVFILGLVNLLMFLVLFFSCRCMGTLGLYSKMSKFKAYTKLYKYHCYYWIILGASIGVHVGIAISVLGWPF